MFLPRLEESLHFLLPRQNGFTMFYKHVLMDMQRTSLLDLTFSSRDVDGFRWISMMLNSGPVFGPTQPATLLGSPCLEEGHVPARTTCQPLNRLRSNPGCGMSSQGLQICHQHIWISMEIPGLGYADQEPHCLS